MITRTTQSGEHWIPVGDETLLKYCTLLHQWTHAILITIDGHESGYTFPLTEDDIQRASILKNAIKQTPKSLHIDDFHNFIKPFMYLKVVGRSIGPFTKWDDVFECLFALSALREDGNFQPAGLITQMFVKMKYFIRSMVLYEAMRERQDDEVLLYG